MYDIKSEIDWSGLKFKYYETDYRYKSYWKNGNWENGVLVEENDITMGEAAAAIHYGQQCFEGLKAYRTKDNKIQLFRPDINARRMQKSCSRVCMPEISTESFIDACAKVVKANEKYLAPYGTGATIYLRPFVIGTGNVLGTVIGDEYLFSVYCSPVGSFFSDFEPCRFLISDYHRAAPNGTGNVKVGGNYAAGALAKKEAKARGFSDCLYLDAKTSTKIEEAGGANFFGITKDNKLVTPKSSSILESITKDSLLVVAKEYLGLEVEERDILVEELEDLVETAVCGTAAVVTPIGEIEYSGRKFKFNKFDTIKKLYDTLLEIQFGDIEAPEGWIYEI